MSRFLTSSKDGWRGLGVGDGRVIRQLAMGIASFTVDEPSRSWPRIARCSEPKMKSLVSVTPIWSPACRK